MVSCYSIRWTVEDVLPIDPVWLPIKLIALPLQPVAEADDELVFPRLLIKLRKKKKNDTFPGPAYPPKNIVPIFISTLLLQSLYLPLYYQAY
jgi:hypothetical protein